MLISLPPTMIKSKCDGVVLDMMAGRLHLSDESYPLKHCLPSDSALLYLCRGQFPAIPKVSSYHIAVLPALASLKQRR